MKRFIYQVFAAVNTAGSFLGGSLWPGRQLNGQIQRLIPLG